ncbi:radical SAM family heme chaperone HemW [Galbibacter mesophilus]|uniref:radical SAM family heme chaperone HemW n=1 Tax=Galbibacter mesophilus TaxID=379069 RepID=UPI00191EC1DB|nr:radical SAM family heme chaperone HemW [Galbibacter mesophilus]MCM5662113.1 radical SAM family heme chaperone HemW [Galbibacter mesophilus]
MAGIYLHIPFCKQACHYCDFHFSTSLKKKDEMLQALAKELVLRKRELNEPIETIYFGGGTPSVLATEEINFLIETVYNHYEVISEPEITLEANPDDLSKEKIIALAESPVNRLSIGIQSFFEEDLKLMNRAHNAEEAEKCLEWATRYFANISIDLIYGIQHMSETCWIANIEKALGFGVPHISCYALTVEPKTALASFIDKGIIDDVDDALAEKHFDILVDTLTADNFVHYELSNFGKEGFFSKNNTAYWLQKKYLGVGPSAHSFNGTHRSWNINNNSKYIAGIASGKVPSEVEKLSKTDRYNEAVMTGLRTIWGVSLHQIEEDFGERYKMYLLQQAEKYIHKGLLEITSEENNEVLTTTKKGKFLADGIASHLFMLNL